MARKIKVPAKAPPPSPEDLLPHARLAWGRLAVTRLGADLWPLSRMVKERAVRDDQSAPLSFGVRRLRALDDRTQLVVIGVGGAASPARFDAPRESLGIIAREHPAVAASFSPGYFSDEISAEECVRNALDELLAAPAWRALDARLITPRDPEHPRVIALTVDEETRDDDGCWHLWLEHAEGEATVIRGRVVPREGDTYEAGRVRTLRRATDEGETLRVIGVPLATVRGAEPVVSLRYNPQRGAGQRWTDAADAELRAALSGSYPIAEWLLAPSRDAG